MSRLLSGLLAALYLAAAYFTADIETTFRIGMYLILPLACIWFSDAMGGYTGSIHAHSAVVPTPGCFVAFGGWLLLLLPLLIAMAYAMLGVE